MLKKLITLSTLFFSLSASAGNFSEGEHYIDLGNKAFKADNQVVKVYSVNCPFCYKYEQAVIPKMEQNLPSGMTYDAYHITTKPPLGVEKSTAVAVAKVMGDKQYKKVKMALYAKYHDKKEHFANGDEVITFAAKQLNISVAEFNKKAAAPEVAKQIAKWDQGVEIAKIQGIPALVVNGKYLIKTSAIRSMPMLDELIADLAKK